MWSRISDFHGFDQASVNGRWVGRSFGRGRFVDPDTRDMQTSYSTATDCVSIEPVAAPASAIK